MRKSGFYLCYLDNGGYLPLEHNSCVSNPLWLIFLVVILTLTFLAGCSKESDVEDQLDNSFSLLNLPANRWTKYHELESGDWWRKGHAGLAYDSTRGSLLVFGSDTHGEDWDNIVHEFIPRQRRWVHHGVNAHSNTYKVNSEGYPVAGDPDLAPWAMHTYDGLDYVPSLDALVVVASPSHNPIGKKIPGKAKSHPIWLYRLNTKKWSIFEDERGAMPNNFFGAATAYDKTNNNLFICKSGLWLLNLTTGKSKRLGNSSQCLHRTMVFDSLRRHLYLFGSYKGTSDVLRFDIGFFSEKYKNSKWEVLAPGGDHCPKYGSVPVAFDEMTGIFLLIVNDKKISNDGKTNSASTFIYDPKTNEYKELIDTYLPTSRMNFMMAWDKVHEVFFLLTGNWKDGVSVWALRLDRAGLASKVRSR